MYKSKLNVKNIAVISRKINENLKRVWFKNKYDKAAVKLYNPKKSHAKKRYEIAKKVSNKAGTKHKILEITPDMIMANAEKEVYLSEIFLTDLFIESRQGHEYNEKGFFDLYLDFNQLGKIEFMQDSSDGLAGSNGEFHYIFEH